MTTALLKAIADAAETDAGAVTSANLGSAGWWKRIAAALEDIAGATTTANATPSGYMKRAAAAAEVIAGASTSANANEPGYLTRIVEALETVNSATYSGSLLERFRQGIVAYEPGGADVTAPILSAPVDDASGATGAAISVDTDEGNGTLYWAITDSAVAPSAEDIIAGTGAEDAGSQAVSSTGTQNAAPSGLTASATRYAHFVHVDAADNVSNIVSGDGFKVGRGPELIVGGDFANAGDWTANATASVSSGAGNLDGNGATTPTLSQAVAFEATATYEVIFDITVLSAGNIRCAFIGGTSVTGTNHGTTGTKTQQLAALTGNVTFRLQATNSSGIGKVDNASVRKVLT